MKYLRVDDTDIDIVVLGFETLVPKYITSIKSDDIEDFMQKDEMTQIYGQAVHDKAPYKPLYREICVVKLDGGIWCRCSFEKEVSDAKAEVYAIDYGSLCLVEMANIRVISFEYK